jgi:hypothetical protein
MFNVHNSAVSQAREPIVFSHEPPKRDLSFSHIIEVIRLRRYEIASRNVKK